MCFFRGSLSWNHRPGRFACSFFSRLTRWWNDSFYIRRHSGNLWESDGKNEYTAKTKRFWMNGRTTVAKKRTSTSNSQLHLPRVARLIFIWSACCCMHTWCERTCVVWYQDTFIAHQSEQKMRKQLVLCRQNIGLAWTCARLFLLRTTEKKFVKIFLSPDFFASVQWIYTAIVLHWQFLFKLMLSFFSSCSCCRVY